MSSSALAKTVPLRKTVPPDTPPNGSISAPRREKSHAWEAIPILCRDCAAPFEPNRPWQAYCSAACRHRTGQHVYYLRHRDELREKTRLRRRDGAALRHAVDSLDAAALADAITLAAGRPL